jgi:hypothetical protein
MTKLMEMALTTILKVLPMWELGWKINSKAREEKTGLMGLTMKEATWRAKNTEWASFNGLTVLLTRGSGKITKCMEVGHSNGETVELIRVIISTIKSKGTVFILGLMAEFTEDGFTTENSMERAFTSKSVERKSTACGSEARRS